MTFEDKQSEFKSKLKIRARDNEIKSISDTIGNQFNSISHERIKNCALLFAKYFIVLNKEDEKLFDVDWGDGPKIDIQMLA